MLKREFDFIAKCEVGGFAAQLPNEVPSGTINFVYGVGVSSRYEVVTRAVFVNGVDVEVVPSIRAIVARASLTGIEG
jgi:hypothetical protein